MSMIKEYPHLVQRVRWRKMEQEGSKGIDRLFEMDYMGAAEFEWGSLPAALKAMRADKNYSWIIQCVHAINAQHACYYVGSPATLPLAERFFIDQLKPAQEREGRTKERTGIFETYLTNTTLKYDGWWAIDAVPPFALFRIRKHAEKFMNAL